MTGNATSTTSTLICLGLNWFGWACICPMPCHGAQFAGGDLNLRNSFARTHIGFVASLKASLASDYLDWFISVASVVRVVTLMIPKKTH
jgi:hypothetical protein